eukprot:549154_1
MSDGGATKVEGEAIQRLDKGVKGKRRRKNGLASHDEKLSRWMSRILRHEAVRLNLSVSSSGFVPVHELIALRPNTTESEIKKCVEYNDKQRFALKRGEDGTLLVRANQGHSHGVAKVISDGELLLPISSPDELPEVIAHGTYFSALPAIEKDGLSRMSRAHVHLAENVPEAGGVISGMRKSCQAIVWVNARAAIFAGLIFYRSSNGVILTPGDSDGYIRPKFIARIERRCQKTENY